MRDVTLCNYGNPKKLKNGLYNFSKLRILVQMVTYIILPCVSIMLYSLRKCINIRNQSITILPMIEHKCIVLIFAVLKNTS